MYNQFLMDKHLPKIPERGKNIYINVKIQYSSIYENVLIYIKFVT